MVEKRVGQTSGRRETPVAPRSPDCSALCCASIRCSVHPRAAIAVMASTSMNAANANRPLDAKAAVATRPAIATIQK
jgi:hypothetical protein